jgi:hypothetical protein
MRRLYVTLILALIVFASGNAHAGETSDTVIEVEGGVKTSK